MTRCAFVAPSCRFFAVEVRHLRAGDSVLLSYYPDEKKSSNVKEAGESVPLQSIAHVSLMASSGRLPLYLAVGSNIEERLRRELQSYADVLLEVETPSRVYFLRADTKREACMWVAGLQRLCGLPVDVHWPADLRELPKPLPSVVAARLADGSLDPALRSALPAALGAQGEAVRRVSAAGLASTSRTVEAAAAAAASELARKQEEVTAAAARHAAAQAEAAETLSWRTCCCCQRSRSWGWCERPSRGAGWAARRVV